MTEQTQPTDAEISACILAARVKCVHPDAATTIDIARAVLAKWGTPAGAGEPYAYAVYFPDQPCEELVHDLDDLCDDLTNREHTITKLYTTPQPTQAQAGAVPLPKFLALKFHARRDKKATVTLLFQDHETADAWVRGIRQKGADHA